MEGMMEGMRVWLCIQNFAQYGGWAHGDTRANEIARWIRCILTDMWVPFKIGNLNIDGGYDAATHIIWLEDRGSSPHEPVVRDGVKILHYQREELREEFPWSEEILAFLGLTEEYRAYLEYTERRLDEEMRARQE